MGARIAIFFFSRAFLSAMLPLCRNRTASRRRLVRKRRVGCVHKLSLESQSSVNVCEDFIQQTNKLHCDKIKKYVLNWQAARSNNLCFLIGWYCWCWLVSTASVVVLQLSCVQFKRNNHLHSVNIMKSKYCVMS